MVSRGRRTRARVGRAAVPAIREAIVAHARAEYPNEACGLIVGDAAGGRTAAGPSASSRPGTRPRRRYRYEIDPDDLLRLTIATDDADEVFWGIVHSHTHTPARTVAHRRRARVLPGLRCTSWSR